MDCKMLKKVALFAGLMMAAYVCNADVLAVGTVTQINISNGSIAAQLTAGTGSPCPTGWFYAYDTDTSATVVNRLLAALLSAQSRGVSVSLYANAYFLLNQPFCGHDIPVTGLTSRRHTREYK